jgi:hypothetical protein
MKVNEIINKLEKAGFQQSRAYKIANLTHEGAWCVGKYLGPMEIEIDGEKRINQKFAITEGEALMGKDAKAVEKIEAGEYVVFGSGLLNWILANKHKTGDNLAVVYKGMDSYKEGKKTIKSHQFEVMAK